jgi:predicted amidohydrolase
MKIAALQMTSSADVAENLRVAETLVSEAAADGAQLAALPENFAFMGLGESDKLQVAEAPGTGPIQTALAAMARANNIWLVGGTIPLRRDAGPRVSAAELLFDPSGQCVARYNKIHLFDVDVPGASESHRESRHIAPGDASVVAATPLGRLGLAVCYDIRFPELFRQMAQERMDGFVLPSAFTAPTGRAHWETLLRARAIENQSWAIAPAQSGFHANGRETYGDSMIIDHWGRVLARLPRGTGVVVAEIDPKEQQTAREKFPALQHRRLD